MIRLRRTTLLLVVSLAFFTACDDDPSSPSGSGLGAPLAGGATTIFDATSNAFSTPAPNLDAAGLARHMEGDAAFEAAFVAAPAPVQGGLGPVFNNTSCVACHPRDGRGQPPEPSGLAASMFLRISVPGANPDGTGAPTPVPGFGSQLFDKAIFGVTPMGLVQVSYAERVETFADGETYSLLVPSYSIVSPYQELPPDVRLSPRVAPPVFGRGLLEAIDDATLLELADENDANEDGISGRTNIVWDYAAGVTRVGRFGLKASNPSLLQQVAGAYRGDIGVTNPYFGVESSFGTALWDGAHDEPEVDEETLALATFYVQTLAVPARRNTGDSRVRRGEWLFTEANCSACHVPSLTTGTLAGVPEVSNQTIFAYTDLLLHDMGEGLADGRDDFAASGNEWRTPPLWGIGLTNTVNGHTFFLHDGRARNLMEAVMWHGGEAESAREFVRNLPASDRRALIAFLESL